LQKSKAKNAVRLMKCSRLSEGGNHHDGIFLECGGTGVFDNDAALDGGAISQDKAVSPLLRRSATALHKVLVQWKPRKNMNAPSFRAKRFWSAAILCSFAESASHGSSQTTCAGSDPFAKFIPFQTRQQQKRRRMSCDQRENK
jgi:hypothetical protein